MFKMRRISRLAYLLMSFLLFAGFIFPLAALPVKGAGNPQKIANMVIFVKMQGDTRDIYNAVDNTYGTPVYNWQQIRKMYDGGTGYSGDNSFSNYIKTISEGKIEVVNVFPQEYMGDDGIARVRTLELSKSSYDHDSLMIEEVIRAIQDGKIPVDTSQTKLDNLNRGILDNLTIVVQGNDINGQVHSYRAQYGGTETFGAAGLRVSEYNAMYSAALVTDDGSIGVSSQQGVIAHEFLHTLDFPDLYRFDGSGTPVGVWDIMAGTTPFLQYPLGYLRAQKGWITSSEIRTSGTYTLTAVSEQGGNKLFTIRTPMSESDSEIICLEYRKKNADINGFEHKIYSSGLLMYRVDTSVADATNSKGENYIYVYRPGVTDPEKAADTDEYGINLVSKAAVDVSNGETEYGSTDLSKTFLDDTLYYSDGKNSGVRISNLKLSPDGNSVTFRVDFADYNAAQVWDSMGKNAGTDVGGSTPFLYTDPASGRVYITYGAEKSGRKQVVVKRWNESAGTWEQIGSGIDVANNMPMPVVAVFSKELYLAYLDGSNGTPVYRKLIKGSWGNAAALSEASYPQALQLITDGSGIYAAYAESTKDGRARLVIKDLKNNTTVTDALKANYFSMPSVVKMGTRFYAAYADFPNGNGRIDVYDTAAPGWRQVHDYGSKTNSHILRVKDGVLYGFAGGNNSNPTITVYNGEKWSDKVVANTNNYYSPSMEIVNGLVYLAYVENSTNRTMLIRQTEGGFETCYDNLGSSLIYLGTSSHGKTIYVASQAVNSSTVVVRKKDMSWSGTPVKPVTPPSTDPPGGTDPTTPVRPPWQDEVDRRTGVDGFVYRLYVYALNREPDEGGLNDWKNKLTNRERTGTEVALGFFFSDEMKIRGLSNADFVELLYKVMMNRGSDASGKAYWMNMLDNGVSRMGVFNGFAGSKEFESICGNYGINKGTPVAVEGRDKNYGATLFVARLYTQALGRGYDVDGLNDWCNRIVSGTWSVTDVSTTGFFESPEFLGKNLGNEEYVKVLYRTFLGREYDTAGLNDWVGKLNRGEMDRTQVLKGFSYSPEFANIMKQYGL